MSPLPPTAILVENYVSAQLERLDQLGSADELEEWHRRNLGKSGTVLHWKRTIGSAPSEERRTLGQLINSAWERMAAAFEARQEQVKLDLIARGVAASGLDVTLPAAASRRNGYHPVTSVMNEICDIFVSLGFGIFESPEVETDEFNFQLLNMPPHHPARDMQDTFYVSSDVVLRTHTSPGQIHAMRRYAPNPCRVVLPGRCFRNEDVNPRSEMQFHQIEGLVVGPSVKFSDLKGLLLNFARRFYGDDQQIRMRGSYFPFTEPSVEVDILCTICHGRGCRICKEAGWLEVLGAGLVHPDVLKNGHYDPAQVRGLAFGMGVERAVLLRHQITDIRLLFQNDLRFLEQVS
jgi:phenylalanyl-tRNA synthetase alpha chain